jgi:hypothetical protein
VDRKSKFNRWAVPSNGGTEDRGHQTTSDNSHSHIRTPYLGKISAFDLRQYAGDVAHAPMLCDLAARYAEDIAGGESQAFPGRRHAQQHAMLRAGIDEARRDVVIGRDQYLDGHLEIGDAFQPRGKERDRGPLGLDAGGWRWCGSAVLMIDIILGEKRREAVDVVRAQRYRELLGDVTRARLRSRRNAGHAQGSAGANQG